MNRSNDGFYTLSSSFCKVTFMDENDSVYNKYHSYKNRQCKIDTQMFYHAELGSLLIAIVSLHQQQLQMRL